MKKTYVLVLLVLLVAFLSQSVVYATDNENDYQKVIELSREKLGNQRITVQLMDGLNSYERFYLAEGVESGYLIYDRDNGIFLEYSAEDSSPFGNSMGDKKYIGPTYYYVEVNNELTDLGTGNKVGSDEKQKLIAMENQIKESIAVNKEHNSTEAEKSGLNKRNAAHKHEIDDIMSSDLPDFTEVEYAFYFENLRNIGRNVAGVPGHPEFEGTCTFVAVEMMLSYYDSVIDDDIIPEAFDVTVSRNFSSSSDYSDLVSNIYSESPGIWDDFHATNIANMNTGNSMNLAEAKDLAEDYLDAADIDYELHYLGFWEGLFVPDKASWARTGITAGNPVYIAISGTDTTIVNDEIHHAVVGYRYDDDSIIAHSGWRNMTINDGSPRTAIHINGYTVNEAFYFDVDTAHSHSYNYTWHKNGTDLDGTLCICGQRTCDHETTSRMYLDCWEGLDLHDLYCGFCNRYLSHEGHNYTNGICTNCGVSHTNHTYVSGTCSTCGYVHSNHTLGTTYYGTASSHYKKCTICNANIYCSSTATVISNTSTTHTVDCSACGYSKTSTHTYNSNNDCTVCGYHTTHTHLYTDHYAFYSSLQHKAYCSCGNYVLRAHLGLAQAPGMPIYCASCGYEMDDGE